MYHTNAAYIRMMEAARAYLQAGGKMQDLERDLKSLSCPKQAAASGVVLPDSSWACRGTPSFAFVPPKQEPSTQERIAVATERIAAALEAISTGVSRLATPAGANAVGFAEVIDPFISQLMKGGGLADIQQLRRGVPLDLTGSQNGGEPLSDADPEVMPPMPDMDVFISEILGKEKETD